MKKMVCAVVLLLLFSTVAHATEFENFAIIASAYTYWSQAFGATDVSQEAKFNDNTEDPEGKRLFTDDLVIDCSPDAKSLYKTEQVVLFASLHSGGTTAYNQARTLGLFAALEYGAPSTFSAEEIDSAYSIARTAYNDYSLAMVSNMERIESGELVLFRMNEHGRYYIAYVDNVGFCIMVQ